MLYFVHLNVYTPEYLYIQVILTDHCDYIIHKTDESPKNTDDRWHRVSQQMHEQIIFNTTDVK